MRSVISIVLFASCLMSSVSYATIETYQYEYDLDNKLIEVTPPADKSGANAIIDLTYDANGNMRGDGSGNHYSYDLENELISYSDTKGTTGTYTYYPNTMRASKQVNNNSPITFYYNGDKYAQIINEAQEGRSNSGLSYTSYAMLGNNRYVRLVHDNSNDSITKQYLIKDNKNVIAKLGNTGKINSSYAYDPYGKEINLDKAKQTNKVKEDAGYNLIANPFGYESEYKDSESGLIYLRARYYSPQLMRFISRDTADLPNRYNYADGNPISNVDPSGHASFFTGLLKWFKSLCGQGNQFIEDPEESISNSGRSVLSAMEDPYGTIKKSIGSIKVLGESIASGNSEVIGEQAASMAFDDLTDNFISNSLIEEKVIIPEKLAKGSREANKLSLGGDPYSFRNINSERRDFHTQEEIQNIEHVEDSISKDRFIQDITSKKTSSKRNFLHHIFNLNNAPGFRNMMNGPKRETIEFLGEEDIDNNSLFVDIHDIGEDINEKENFINETEEPDFFDFKVTSRPIWALKYG